MKPSLAVPLALICCLGCRSDARVSSLVVRDSAGIRIFETVESVTARDRVALAGVPFSAGLPDFGDIIDVAPGRQGNLVVLDALAPHIVVLDSAGAERARFGGDGEGPGEFWASGLTDLVVLGDTVAVPDLLNQRISLFDLGGAVLGSVPVSVAEGLTLDWRRAGDRLVVRRVSTPQRIETLSLVDPGFETLMDLGSLALPSAAGPLAALPGWCRLADGRLVVGRTDQYLLKVTDRGAVTTILDGGAREQALSEGDAAHIGELLRRSLSRRLGSDVAPERIRQLLDQTPLPEHAPLVSAVRCVGSREVWVQRALAVGAMGEDVLRVGSTQGWGSEVWDVFDLEARTLRQAVFPAGTQVTRVTDGMVTGYTQDEYGRKAPARWIRR